jgi:hypothetical protein
MTFAQRRNRLTTHFSERIAVVEWRLTVYIYIYYFFCIILLHNCTKIQYLLYSNCSKCPPPVAMQFSTQTQKAFLQLLTSNSPFIMQPRRDCIPLSRTNMRSVRVTRQLNRYSTWNRKKTKLFSGHYLRNRSTLDIGVLGYIGIL